MCPDWSIPKPILMCIWDHCHVGTPTCTIDPIFWLMTLGFSEEFGDSPPSSLFHLLSLEQQVAAKQPHSIILPSPVLLDSRCGVLGVKGLTFAPPNIAAHYGQTNQFLFHLTTEVSSRKFFSLSMWSAAKLQLSFKLQRLEQGICSYMAASRTIMMQNTPKCGHWHQSSSSFDFMVDFLVVFDWLLTILNTFFSQQQVIAFSYM